MINAMLPKMGYSSKTTRDVVFGPRKYLGIGLGPEQGVQQTLFLLKHLRANQKLSTLRRIGLTWFQLQSGITQPVLECPGLDIPYLEIGWFQSLCQFFCSIQAEIHVELTHIARPLRVNETSTMNALLALQKIPPERLYQINLCRLFLFKSNAYPKFAILSAPKFFKKSGKDTNLTAQKLHYCGQTNHDHTRSHGQNDAQFSMMLSSTHYYPGQQSTYIATALTTIRPLDWNPTSKSTQMETLYVRRQQHTICGTSPQVPLSTASPHYSDIVTSKSQNHPPFKPLLQ
jgi:hypothetical protein